MEVSLVATLWPLQDALFYFKDSHVYYLSIYSGRLLYLTVHRILQNRLKQVCTMKETWKWLAVGRLRCGAAVRVMRIKKPSVWLGAFLCWLSYWRHLMKTCWFPWLGHCKNVHQRYPSQPRFFSGSHWPAFLSWKTICKVIMMPRIFFLFQETSIPLERESQTTNRTLIKLVLVWFIFENVD